MKRGRAVYYRSGHYFKAMMAAPSKRQYDMTIAAVLWREHHGRYFKPGWDDLLMVYGLIIHIHHDNPNIEIWMVDSDSSAAMLGSKSALSVEKNLETSRGLRYLPPEYRTIPLLYGFSKVPYDGEYVILDDSRDMVIGCHCHSYFELPHVPPVYENEQPDGVFRFP